MIYGDCKRAGLPALAFKYGGAEIGRKGRKHESGLAVMFNDKVIQDLQNTTRGFHDDAFIDLPSTGKIFDLVDDFNVV